MATDQTAAAAAAIRAAMSGLREPTAADKIYKEECVYSFAGPSDAGGLFINLRTFSAVSPEFVSLDVGKVGSGDSPSVLYLHWWEERRPKAAAGGTEGEKKPLTKLGIGVEGGAQLEADKYDIVNHYSLSVVSQDAASTALEVAPPTAPTQVPGGSVLSLPLDHADVPMMVKQVADRVLALQDANKQKAAKDSKWEFEAQISAFHMDLPVIADPPAISPDPKSWKCYACEKTDNLWLNLSSGVIACGRKQWGGLGGNGHALQHFEETGSQFPLVVKLGTITPEGADVFSYHPSEDDMVKDPKLAEHLTRFGINVMELKKTDKSMEELQLDLNNWWESDRIIEKGQVLEPAVGAGFVGLKNLGNSCYINSTLQVLFSLPEFRARYLNPAPEIFQKTPADQVAGSLHAQLAKLAVGLLTDKYVNPAAREAPPALAEDADDEARKAFAKAQDDRSEASFVAPATLRALVGQGHEEFETAKQQDAFEYVNHLLFSVMPKAEKATGSAFPGATVVASLGGDTLGRMFEFGTERRLACTVANTVRFSAGQASSLSLRIPLEAATNKEDVDAYQARKAAWEVANAGGEAAAGTAEAGAAKAAKRDAAATAGAAASAGALPAKFEEPAVVPTVPFEACLATHFAPSEIPGVVSPSLDGQKTLHIGQNSMRTFPRVLMVQMARYTIGADWKPKKIDASVPVPETLDLSQFAASRKLEEGQTLLPDEEPAAEGAAAGGGAAAAPAAAPEPDAAIVAAVTALGISENGAKRAALAVDNSGAEMAAAWAFEHSGDADFNDPLPAASAAAPADAPASAGASFDAGSVSMLTAMGFEEAAAKKALFECGMSVEAAADWLMTHVAELATMDLSIPAPGDAAAATGAGAAPAAPAEPFEQGELETGAGKYSLVGIISHIGGNTGSGHYVCHVKKDGRWYIFNDRKVAVSAHPPLDLGYCYFFRRDDAPSAAAVDALVPAAEE